jgi:alpha-beta hydrolase superfamily lysophospholipase
MVEHSGRYAGLGEALASRGIALRVPDLRGHGETDRDGGWGSLTDDAVTAAIQAPGTGFRRCVQDLQEVAVSIRAGDQGVGASVPLWILGHSFGSILTLTLLESLEVELTGCILSGVPAPPSAALKLGGSLVVAAGMRFRGPKAPAKLPRKMTFGAYARSVPDAQTACDWLTRDEKIVRAYMADPACSFTCSYSFYRDLQHGIAGAYSPASLAAIPKPLPILLIGGSADPTAGGRAGFAAQVERLRSLGLEDFDAKLYEGGRHEMLNETNKAEVIGDILRWMEARSG